MGKAIIIGINKFADPNEKMIETNGDRKDIGDFEKMALSWGWECIKLLNEHCSTADLQTKLRDRKCYMLIKLLLWLILLPFVSCKRR